MEMTAQELYKKIKNKQDIFLLDVRTKKEYEEDKIKNTTLIPIQVLDTKLNELPRNKIIITICAHGNRSMRAAIYLKEKKYDVFSLKGGIEAWNDFIKNEES